MKKLGLLISLVLMFACSNNAPKSGIPSSAVDKTIQTLSSNASNKEMMERGVKQVAHLWEQSDGTADDFVAFCTENYVADPAKREQLFLHISQYLEAIYGNFNEMTLGLQRNVHENTGELLPIDEQFAAYDPASHFSDDMYANKLAFIVALNFPQQSLDEKETLGVDRLAWAYARIGDVFTARVPAAVQQAASNAASEADIYISNYNIFAGHLLNKEGKQIFPKEMILLSHWNLRDEIKANYNKGDEGLDKQQTIYEVMKRIVLQEIPSEVINSGNYEWNPYANEVFQNGTKIEAKAEDNIRYEKLLRNFKALKAIDSYTGNTYIDRSFLETMEVALPEIEKIFDHFLSSPEMKEVGKVISQRLGRDMQAFDIWYDGFKLRSSLNEDKLSEQTRALYPNAAAMEKDLPNILRKLGFTPQRALEISEKIAVDAARGSGHAWGGQMKGQKAHLRTRVPAEGMDYKGYNIAVHEFGHNVEQTISLYDVDYYMMNGVPNTAFTETLAFIFQKRDLELLGYTIPEDHTIRMNDVLDKAWSLFEICGVSMLDIAVWKWMYAHPDATPEQLKEATVNLAKEVWNKYFAPVFGVQDEPILAIYSHMISYPLYLSNYAFGHVVEFQLEQYLQGKNFALEVDRIYRLGRLTPNQWMMQATGQQVSTDPMLKAIKEVLPE